MTLLLKSLPMVAALAAAMSLPACAPSANTGRSAVSDGVKFEYTLAPASGSQAAHTYHIRVALTDAATGARIPGATVALNLFGPGYPGGTSVNLGEEPNGGYSGDVSLPNAATYNLTFQANRKAPAPSAQAVFETARPSGD